MKNNTSSIFPLKYILIPILFIGLIMSVNSYAIHVSTYRILLDDEKRTTSFHVTNSDLITQQCELRLKHYYLDDSGNMQIYPEDELPENSAQPWLKYSPRKFLLTPKNRQAIRFSLRRKAKSSINEYRSFVSVDCTPAKVEREEGELIAFSPKIIHTIPIIVRVGEHSVEASINNVEVSNGVVKFNLERKGTRSIYGDVDIVDKRNNNIINSIRGTSVYTENNHRSMSMPMRKQSPENLLLRFTEHKHLSGNILVEKQLVK